MQLLLGRDVAAGAQDSREVLWLEHLTNPVFLKYASQASVNTNTQGQTLSWCKLASLYGSPADLQQLRIQPSVFKFSLETWLQAANCTILILLPSDSWKAELTLGLEPVDPKKSTYYDHDTLAN